MTLTPQAIDDVIGHAQALIWAVRRDIDHGYYLDMVNDEFESILVKFGLVKPPVPELVTACDSRPDVEF